MDIDLLFLMVANLTYTAAACSIVGGFYISGGNMDRARAWGVTRKSNEAALSDGLAL